MITRLTKPSALLLAALLLASCSSFARARKDAALGAATPALVLYKGTADAEVTANEVGAALGGGSYTRALAFPLTFVYHALEHSAYGVIHLVDLPLCAAYSAVELLPQGPEIETLDLYDGACFREWAAAADASAGSAGAR